MKTHDFDFNLPENLIATHPNKERSSSRLLCLGRYSGSIEHRHFYDLPNLLNSNDLLVINNSKVIPARVYGQKESGGKVEMLFERMTSETRALVHLRASKALNPGRILFLGKEKTPFKILSRQGDLFEIEKQDYRLSWLAWLEAYGHIPLPPYMNREEESEDLNRYQTVYAEHQGSIAAPTAGLHFDDIILEKIRSKGVEIKTLTLHVGSGTFQPVRVENIEKHHMHYESFSLPKSTIDSILACKKRGGRVIAVGTTTVRTLESAAEIILKHSDCSDIEQETNIFIYPGFEFRIVDAMITNFHLPKSTLIMLVSAFSTKNNVINAYEQAIKEKYRFYSYGDAMFITA